MVAMASYAFLCLFGFVATVNAARQPNVALLDLQQDSPPGPHQQYTAELSKVRDQSTKYADILTAVEENTASDGERALPQPVQAIGELGAGIETLRHVRANVNALNEQEMPPAVRLQVVWNLDRCGNSTTAARPHFFSLAHCAYFAPSPPAPTGCSPTRSGCARSPLHRSRASLS